MRAKKDVKTAKCQANELNALHGTTINSIWISAKIIRCFSLKYQRRKKTRNEQKSKFEAFPLKKSTCQFQEEQFSSPPWKNLS